MAKVRNNFITEWLSGKLNKHLVFRQMHNRASSFIKLYNKSRPCETLLPVQGRSLAGSDLSNPLVFFEMVYSVVTTLRTRGFRSLMRVPPTSSYWVESS